MLNIIDTYIYIYMCVCIQFFSFFLKFVAHPNVQQLLAAIWYDGLPGFRRKNMIGQFIDVGKLAAMFPVYSSIYMLSPTSPMGLFMKKPFVKFICHSSSYAFFLSKKINRFHLLKFNLFFIISLFNDRKIFFQFYLTQEDREII